MDKPKWNTWVKTKEKKTMGVKTNGDAVYPDIVVTDAEKKGSAIIAGEIETEETIDDDEAKQWDRYGKLCGTCYVYVPEGSEKETKKLIEKGKLSVTGVRTYRFEESKLIVSDV